MAFFGRQDNPIPAKVPARPDGGNLLAIRTVARMIPGLFDPAGAPRVRPWTRGSSSGVEHHVANVRVEGSNPFSRSIALATSRQRLRRRQRPGKLARGAQW